MENAPRERRAYRGLARLPREKMFRAHAVRQENTAPVFQTGGRAQGIIERELKRRKGKRMDRDFDAKLNEFKAYIKDMEYLSAAIAGLYWDSRTYIPRSGAAYRGEVLGYLSAELYRKQTSQQMCAFLDYFSARPDLDDVTRAMVDRLKREYDRTVKIPEERYRAYVVAVSAAETAWEDAKRKADYVLFAPHLKKLIAFNREFIGYWGGGDNGYDLLLDYFEPGATVAQLDAVFGDLRDAIVALLHRIRPKPRPDDEFLKGVFRQARRKSSRSTCWKRWASALRRAGWTSACTRSPSRWAWATCASPPATTRASCAARCTAASTRAATRYTSRT
jgi:hypothetical protein